MPEEKNKKEEECPLCRVSEETLRKLRESKSRDAARQSDDKGNNKPKK